MEIEVPTLSPPACRGSISVEGSARTVVPDNLFGTMDYHTGEFSVDAGSASTEEQLAKELASAVVCWVL